MFVGSLFSLGSSNISLLDFFIKNDEFFFFISVYSFLIFSVLDSFIGLLSVVLSLRYLLSFCFYFSIYF